MEGNRQVLFSGLLVLISVIYAAHSEVSTVPEHCLKKKIFQSNYTPRGDEYEIGNLTVYESPNRSSKRLVIAGYDALGWQSNNIKEVVDTLAERYDFRVVLPDFYRGFPWPDTDWPPADPEEFDHWLPTNASWDIAKWDLYTVINDFSSRENITEVAIFGLCWGGMLSTRASTQMGELFKAAALVHPSLIENSEGEGVKVPMYLMPAKNDPDMLRFYEVLIQNFGDNSGHTRFNDMLHGFVGAGGDFSDPLNRQRVDEVIDILGTFFTRNFSP